MTIDPTPTGRKVFLAYLDDNDLKRETYVYLISKDNTMITFRTKTNLITIPLSRVLKIKEDISEAANDRDPF